MASPLHLSLKGLLVRFEHGKENGECFVTAAQLSHWSVDDLSAFIMEGLEAPNDVTAVVASPQLKKLFEGGSECSSKR